MISIDTITMLHKEFDNIFTLTPGDDAMIGCHDFMSIVKGNRLYK